MNEIDAVSQVMDRVANAVFGEIKKGTHSLAGVKRFARPGSSDHVQSVEGDGLQAVRKCR